MLLKMPHARKHAEGNAEGISSRKVCGSFVADMKFNTSVCVHEKARRNDYSRRRKALLRTRNATLTRRAVANSKPTTAGVFRGSSAEGWPRVGTQVPMQGNPMEPKPTHAAKL